MRRALEFLKICPTRAARYGGNSWSRCQRANRPVTNEKHRNSILNNGQHLFTFQQVMRKPKEKRLGRRKKLWKPVSIRYFVLLNKLIRPDLVRFLPLVPHWFCLIWWRLPVWNFLGCALALWGDSDERFKEDCSISQNNRVPFLKDSAVLSKWETVDRSFHFGSISPECLWVLSRRIDVACTSSARRKTGREAAWDSYESPDTGRINTVSRK